MTKNEKQLSGTTLCSHCGNHAPMEIVSTYSQVQTIGDESLGMTWDSGDDYNLLLCPACKAVTLCTYSWHECDDPDDIVARILYPTANKVPAGLPGQIRTAYEAALKVKTIDANAYAVLLGRVLEMVSLNRKASGKVLQEQLTDLAKRGEIPDKLVGVAKGLRNLRNVGAHPILGELTRSEVPILENLCKAILEYVYSAPLLAQQAEDCLLQLQAKRDKKNRKA